MTGETADLSLLPIGWQALRDRLAETNFSPEAQAAGRWALTCIESHLGRRPWNWSDPDVVPAEIMWCWSHLAALIQVIRLAIAFSRLEGADGLHQVVKMIANSHGPENLASPYLELVEGALACSAGCEVALEPSLSGAETPADIEFAYGNLRLGVEAFAILVDKRTRDASAFVDQLRPILLGRGTELGADFKGRIDVAPEEKVREDLFRGLSTYLDLLARGLTLPPFRVPGVTLGAIAAEGAGGRSDIQLPTVSFGERIGGRLRKKAAQAERSGARWLTVEDFDHLWHLTSFGGRPLGVKAGLLSELIRAELSGADHILGVTFSDGAALMRPEGDEETIISDDFVALVRRCDVWRVRESVIVPLRSEATEYVTLWEQILDVESGWSARELRRNGVDPPRELTGR